MQDVEIKITATGQGTIKVGDQEVQNDVHGLQINAGVGQLTEVVLFSHHPVEFTGPADVVNVTMGLTTEVLSQIPVEQLHKKATALDWHDSTDIVRNVITVLKEMIPDAPRPL